jgi:acyl-CoA synthetase (AMP-forming)/AMP-acid ligase II
MSDRLQSDLTPAVSALERRLLIGDVARHYARLHGIRETPVIIADDGTRTWREIDQAADHLAAYLHHVGLAKGTRIGLLLPNCSSYVEIIFGIARAGMVAVPLSPRFVAREVEHCLLFAEVGALITTVELFAIFEGVLRSFESLSVRNVITVNGSASGTVDYGELSEAKQTAVPDIKVMEDDPCWMPFTSGTSGRAKAALVTHRALVDHWNLVMREFDVGRNDVMLIAGPFYHSLGFVFALACLYAQGRIVVRTNFDPDDVLRSIDEQQVTTMPAAPTMYTMMLASPLRERAGLTSMCTVISAGSPLLTVTKEGLLELFANAGLYEFYGSTETGIVAKLAPEDQRRKIRSVGQPVMGVDVRILDSGGRDVTGGEVGEVFKRGMILAPAYFRNPEATQEHFNGDWITAGDLGRLDDEGYLYLVDRKTDMIITGGVNVFPSEVEEVIAHHDGVAEVAVIGVPDERWGEIVTAIVVTDADTNLSEGEIIEHCCANLSSQKSPRRVIFVDALPKNASGKLLKRVLREAHGNTTSPNERRAPEE